MSNITGTSTHTFIYFKRKETMWNSIVSATVSEVINVSEHFNVFGTVFHGPECLVCRGGQLGAKLRKNVQITDEQKKHKTLHDMLQHSHPQESDLQTSQEDSCVNMIHIDIVDSLTMETWMIFDQHNYIGNDRETLAKRRVFVFVEGSTEDIQLLQDIIPLTDSIIVILFGENNELKMVCDRYKIQFFAFEKNSRNMSKVNIILRKTELRTTYQQLQELQIETEDDKGLFL